MAICADLEVSDHAIWFLNNVEQAWFHFFIEIEDAGTVIVCDKTGLARAIEAESPWL